MVDWCALPEGVVALIARRFQLIEDFIAFRATCSSWQEGTTFKDFYTCASCPKLPLLMLEKYEMPDDDEYTVSVECYDEHHQRKDPEEEHKHLSDYLSASREYRSEYLREHPADEQEFSSLSKGKTCKFSFPEAKDTECRGSKGWLIMVGRRTGNMCLFHPISRLRIPLPKVPISDVMIQTKNFISAVLSARPSETSDYVVMVVFMEEIYTSPGRGVLRTYTGFWKPGNLTWTKVDIQYWVQDLNYYNGKFYALTRHGEVWMCDVSGPEPKASKIIKLPEKPLRPYAQLVECEGRLLIVAPYCQYHHDMAFENDLVMVEIDVTKGSYDIITSLGSSSVFLGRSEGFYIDANEFPGIIQPNSIYFSDGSYQVATPGPSHTENFGSGVWFNF